MIKLNPLTGNFDDVGFPARTITGTANQITVTNGDGVSGNPTLALPQNIHTGASPTFARAVLDNSATASTSYLRIKSDATPSSALEAQLDLYSGSTYARHFYRDSDKNYGFFVNGTTRIRIIGGTGEIQLNGNTNPYGDSTYTLGNSSNYWSNTYTDKIWFNSTSAIDGTSAGVANLTGKLQVNSVQAIYVPDQTNFAGGMFLGNGGGSLSHASGDEGQFNIGVGVDALLSVTTGNYNTAIGRALRSNTTGANNASIGAFSLGANTTGGGNMAIGTYALGTNVDGYNNIAIGASALYNSKGYYNTAIGASAGFTKPSGDGCVFIGYRSGYYETGSNKLFIDNTQRASEADGRAKALVYGVFAATTAAQTLTVNGVLNTSESIQVDGTQVVTNRVIDARIDDAISSGDATTDGVIDALRDAMITHGLIAAA